MAQSITDVAAYILERTGTITTMKLHKLAFYAQAEHIVAHGGAPLFPEDFYAWRSGRCKLVCSSLHGLVTKASSKSHATSRRLLGSRFIGVCVARHDIGPSCVPSARV